MKTIGIIGAMSEEITYLKEKIEIVTTKNIIGLDFHVGKYCGNSIVLVISGIGKVNAAVCTQVLIDHFGVDYIINTGCAGAIHPEPALGISSFPRMRYSMTWMFLRWATLSGLFPVWRKAISRRMRCW